jgi:integrase
MAKLVNRLTPARVRSIDRPGLHGDGLSLYLQVAGGGSKSWIFRYRRRGQTHDLGLGPAHTVSLAEARNKALKLRKQLINGQDPLADRRNARANRPEAITFTECAHRYIRAHQSGWKGTGRSAEQWASSLTIDAFPVIGKLPVQEIDTGLVMRVLDPIWSVKPVAANRLRTRIEAVLAWATARGYRTGDNPAVWRNHLENLLPRPSRVRSAVPHPAIPLDEIPAFLTALRGRRGVSARCAEFTLLTAVRTKEATGARWEEIDLATGTWTIPGSRMKAGAVHRVPLSAEAVAVLEHMSGNGHGEFIFPGAKAGRPLSDAAMRMLLRLVGRADVTMHGCRAAFSTWAAERTNYPPEIAELALSHKVGTAVSRVYRRTDLYDRRRRLMEEWGHFCSTPLAEPAGELVAIDAVR